MRLRRNSQPAQQFTRLKRGGLSPVSGGNFMIEYESFVYLPVHKTGSTFIADFLQRFCGERLIAADKHRPIARETYDPKKFYFTSVRNPLDQYLSLYSYGVEGSGGLYDRMRRRGYDSLYAGTPEAFRLWLKFVLQPRHAAIVDRRYARTGGGDVAGLLGLQSFRYLYLVTPSPEQALKSCRDEAQLRNLHEQNNIVRFAVRNERLNSDLAALVQTQLKRSIADPAAALAYLENPKHLNASNRIDAYGEAIALEARLKERLQKREWLLHELFGY